MTDNDDDVKFDLRNRVLVTSSHVSAEVAHQNHDQLQYENCERRRKFGFFF